jgi:hypothetical protein
VSRSHHRAIVCRRFAAYCYSCPVFLGLAPQAMDLSRLRRSTERQNPRIRVLEVLPSFSRVEALPLGLTFSPGVHYN